MREDAKLAGDADRMQMWAGQASRLVRTEPAGNIARQLWEDHWDADSIDDLRYESHQANHLTFSVICTEGPSVAPCLHALGNNDIRTRCRSGPRFSDCRSAGKPKDSVGFQFRDEGWSEICVAYAKALHVRPTPHRKRCT